MNRLLPLLLYMILSLQGVFAKSAPCLRDTTKNRLEQQAQVREEDELVEKPASKEAGKVRDKLQKKKNRYAKKHEKKSPKGNFIELDRLMIAIVFALGILLLLLLWFLFRSVSGLGFGWALLLSIGFAMALFFWFLARSEAVDTVAWYEYFIKFGIFAFVGIALILGGFIALFGGTPAMINFLLWGVILGGVSLIISILFNNSILNEIFPFWFK